MENMDNRKSPTGQVSVCLGSIFFYPVYAGPAVRFQSYSPGLNQRGVNMRVFTESANGKSISERGTLIDLKSRQAESSAFEMVGSIPVYRTTLPGGWRRQSAYFSRLADHCEKHRSDIDVVQFLTLNKWAIPSIGKLSRLGIPTVFTHTLLREFSSNPLRGALQRFDRRFPINMFDLVVVSSRAMARQLEDIGVSSPIEVVPNGVDLERFRPIDSEADKAKLRQKLGLGSSWEIVLAVGPISPRKGVDVLIKAMSKVCRENPDVHLVLVGPRQDLNLEILAGFRQKIQRTINGADLQDRVHFTGPVNNVKDYMQAADLMVFPSRREGMPNVVLEAMACGIPVIMTPFIGLPEEFGTPGQHYILSNWDIARLSSDIQELLVDRIRRKNLSTEARKWVEQNLDVNDSLDRYASLYHELTLKKCGRNANG